MHAIQEGRNGTNAFVSSSRSSFTFHDWELVVGHRPVRSVRCCSISRSSRRDAARILRRKSTEKLIVIQFPISSLVRLESENGLIQYLYVISGTNALFQIVDHAPKTQLDSDVKGKVSVEKHRGESTTLGLKVYTPHDLFLDGDATAHHGANDSDSTRFEQLPPLRLIAASGTMHRGLSAYFKLKPSTRTTLEGDKTFAITAHVPASWRAGLIHVNCQAFGQSRRAKPYRDQDDLVCGFVVGEYMQGDAVAKKSVRHLAQSQQHLKYLASIYSDDVNHQRYPSLGHKIGAAFSVVKPRIPESWLDEILTTGELHSFERHLPKKLRDAAAQYREARKQVSSYAG